MEVTSLGYTLRRRGECGLPVEDRYMSNWTNNIGESDLHLSAKYVPNSVRIIDDREVHDIPQTSLISYAISIGAAVDAKDHLGRTPLMTAILTTEDVEVIGRLLSENANIYTCDFQGVSALKMVIEKSRKWLSSLRPNDNHLVILFMFFERIKDDLFTDKTLTLQRLCDVGCPKALLPFVKSIDAKKYLLDSVELDERHGNLTALHVAVMTQDIITVRLLVARGENINAVDSRKQTALFAHDVTAIWGQERFAILWTLLNNGASLYKARNDGITPMEYLLKYGKIRTVEFVLRSKANLRDKCESNGETAIHFLIQNNQLDQREDTPRMIRLLQSRGVDLNTPDNNDVSALTWAIKHEYEDKTKTLLNADARANWIEIVENTSMLDVFMNGYYEKGKAVYYQWVVQLIFLQQGINFKHLFDELNNKALLRKLDNLFYGQTVVANLVLHEAYGQRIPDSTIDYIRSEANFKIHYELCRERLEEMKSMVVYDSLTFYELLMQPDEKIDSYVCNPDFMDGFKFAMSEKSNQMFYYIVLVRKRIERARKIIELRKKSARIISEATGLNMYGISKDHHVANKIVGYLRNHDVLRVCQVPLIPKEISGPPSRTPQIQGNIFYRAMTKFFARTEP